MDGIDPRNPEKWLKAYLLRLPKDIRESDGQLRAIRDYGDIIRRYPSYQHQEMWDEFEAVLTARFPSQIRDIPARPGRESLVYGGPDGESIFKTAILKFSKPGDGSSHWRDTCFEEAMAVVERLTLSRPALERWQLRRELKAALQTWMRENLR